MVLLIVLAVVAGVAGFVLRQWRHAVPFAARVGGKALTPGRYQIAVRAIDAAGNLSRVRTVAVTVC